jgi:hypothetical protein
MATLQLTNAEIVRAVLMEMGLGREGQMDVSTEADVRAILRDGLRRAYFPTIGDSYAYQWRWLEKHASFNVPAHFTTGTIAVASGTITFTGAGTLPTWIEDGFISVDGHILFITDNPTASTATTSNTQLTVTAGAEYTLFRYRYDLPSDFSEWLGGVVYANGTESRMLAGSDESEIRLRYAIGQGLNSRTSHYALTSAPAADEMRMLVWPVPEPDAFIQGVYLSTPDDNLPADLNTPGVLVQVQPIYANVFMYAILAEAEKYAGHPGGINEQRYQAALTRAIAHDKAVGGSYDFSRPLSHPHGAGRVLPTDFSAAEL